MRQPQNAKRGRGRGRRGNNNGGHNHVPNRNTSYESNGPDVKLRGNAQQLHDKYLALAHDAATSGERISAEAFTQFADHYFRLHQAAVGVGESKRVQDQGETVSVDGSKSADGKSVDVNETNGAGAVEESSGMANGTGNANKPSRMKPNVDDGAKLSPASMADAVQENQDDEQQT